MKLQTISQLDRLPCEGYGGGFYKVESSDKYQRYVIMWGQRAPYDYTTYRNTVEIIAIPEVSEGEIVSLLKRIKFEIENHAGSAPLWRFKYGRDVSYGYRIRCGNAHLIYNMCPYLIRLLSYPRLLKRRKLFRAYPEIRNLLEKEILCRRLLGVEPSLPHRVSFEHPGGRVPFEEDKQAIMDKYGLKIEDYEV